MNENHQRAPRRRARTQKNRSERTPAPGPVLPDSPKREPVGKSRTKRAKTGERGAPAATHKDRRVRRGARPGSGAPTAPAPASPANPRPRTSRLARYEGVLRVHPRGFAFCETQEEGSVFVPPKLVKGLLDADIVSVAVRPGTDDAVRIDLLRRTRTEVVGETTGTTVVVDAGTGSLEVPLDGTSELQPGTCVVATLQGNRARVVEVLGDPLSPDALSRRMLARHRLPHVVSREADDEATVLCAQPRHSSQRQRRDLTDVTVITVDADYSEDLDDALSVASAPDGSLRVWVHIADVSEHVLPGSAIDAEAARTPTSVYLPHTTRHMLPRALATSQLSLVPGQVRDVVTVEMRIDADGFVRSVDVYESSIRSSARLSYVTVGRILEGAPTDTGDAESDAVRLLWAAAVRLGRQRLARGGADSSRIDPDRRIEQGEDQAHLLIERLMVATNEAVAAWLEQRGMPVLARVHPAPGDDAADELERVANGIGLWASLPRPVTPSAFASLASQVVTAHQNRVFWDAAMRALERASYTTEPGGHFGLGSARYLHFTSPLRRYADLLVHRVVKGYLAGERHCSTELDSAAAIINDVTRRAELAERHARRADAISKLAPRQKVWCTVIGGPGRGGVRVMLDDHDVVATLVGGENIRAGARVRARVVKADALRDRLELRTSN